MIKHTQFITNSRQIDHCVGLALKGLRNKYLNTNYITAPNFGRKLKLFCREGNSVNFRSKSDQEAICHFKLIYAS